MTFAQSPPDGAFRVALFFAVVPDIVVVVASVVMVMSTAMAMVVAFRICRSR